MQDFLEGLSDKPFDVGDWDKWQEPEAFSAEFPAIKKGTYKVTIKGFSPTQGDAVKFTPTGELQYVTLDFVVNEGEFANRYISFQKVFAATREGKDGITRSGIVDLMKSFGLAKPTSHKDVVAKIQQAIDAGKVGEIDFDLRAKCQPCADERTKAITGVGTLDEARKAATKEQNKQVNKYATIAWSYAALPLLDPKDPTKGRAEYKECPRHPVASGNKLVRAQGNIQRFLAPGEKAAPAGAKKMEW